jgi:hypothetical protein
MFDGELYSSESWTGSKVIVSLPMLVDTIKREIIKGHEFQVIFS